MSSPRSRRVTLALIALMIGCSPDDFSRADGPPSDAGVDGGFAGGADGSFAETGVGENPRDAATDEQPRDAMPAEAAVRDAGGQPAMQRDADVRDAQTSAHEAGLPVDAAASLDASDAAFSGEDSGQTCVAAEALAAWFALEGSVSGGGTAGSAQVVGQGVQFGPGQRGLGLTAGRLEVGTKESLDGIGALTLSMFVRLDRAPDTRNVVLVWKGSTSGDDLSTGYWLLLPGTSFRTENFSFMAGSAAPGRVGFALTDGIKEQVLFSAEALPLGRFTHVAVAYDGRDVRLYLDGVLAQQAKQELLPHRTAYPLQLGSALPGTLDPFIGVLDEIAVFSRALRAEEIAALRDQGGAVCLP